MDLHVDNIGLAVQSLSWVHDFFSTKLGLETEVSSADAHVKLGPIMLYIFQSDSTSRPQTRHDSLSCNPPGLDHVSFLVDDVDRAFSELCKRGLEFVQNPCDREDWGLRVAAFHDPEGSLYFLIQQVK